MNGSCGRLYETLSRYQWWRRRWSGARPGEGLELRKRLAPAPAGAGGGAPAGPADGHEALDRWLFGLAAVPPGARVLDLGCGFGASLLRWVAWCGGSGLGITASRYQAARAAAEAARCGLADRVHFAVQDLGDGLDGAFDAACAIEALGHAHDLARVYGNVHRALRPAGRFVQVEDVLREPGDAAHPDVAELARRWASPPLRTAAALRAALAAAGLPVAQQVDLTARVAAAPPQRIGRRAARLRRWRLLPFPPWHRLVDAFLGGCALERLYAAGRARYVVHVCERR